MCEKSVVLVFSCKEHANVYFLNRGGEGGEWLYQRYFYLIYILLHGFLIGHGFRHHFSSFVYTLRVCVFFCMDFFSFVILLLLSYLASKYFLFF